MTQPSIETLSRNAPLETILAAIERDGAVVISQLLDEKQRKILQGELDDKFEGSGFCEGLFFGARTKRIHSLVAKSSVCREMAVHPTVMSIMNHILGANCDKIQLNLTQGIQIWPGERTQVMHRDEVMFPMKKYDAELMIDVMWAYSDFTKDNGATLVVPGSHKWEDKGRIPRKDETTQAEMKAGDILIYLGSTYHSGGANISQTPRTGIVISYCLGWLRQFENQYFAAPPNVARHFSSELQDLLGYSVHRPNLGMYEGTEPRVLLAEFDQKKIVSKDCLTEDQNEIIKKIQAVEDSGLTLPAHIDELLAPAPLVQQVSRSDV